MYIYLVLIDFKAPYDTVLRKEIWSEMHKLGFPKKLVKLCRILNNEIYANVKIGKHLSSKFKVNKGLRKEDAIAPLLFIVLEIAMDDLKHKLGTQYLTNVVKC